MVAHEVKNPLAATEGWLNLLLSGMVKQDPAEERRMIERSLLRIRTLRLLVSELLNLTAIETGNFTLRRAPVDLPAVVREAVEACRDRAAEKSIELSLEEPAAACGERVLADRDALVMIVTNLVDNAVKYTPEKGRVGVGVRLKGPYLAVCVQDTGIGMSAEEAERVFDEFYRAKNEYTANVPGTGLGLSLVKRLAELHQGRIEVQSSPGKGSAFTLSLPLH
jgi:signal transduction histidine kinase